MADEQNWALPVLAGVVVLGLAAAHGIDKSQWSPRFKPAAAAGRTPAAAAPRATTAARPATTPTPKKVAAPVAPSRQLTPVATVTVALPLGVRPGAAAGAVAARVSTVILQTSVDTCWSMVVDGSAMTGCGPAAVTDTRGAPATTVTRTRGATAVRVEIVRAGRSVATGSVTTDGRPLTLTVG